MTAHVDAGHVVPGPSVWQSYTHLMLYLGFSPVRSLIIGIPLTAVLLVSLVQTIRMRSATPQAWRVALIVSAAMSCGLLFMLSYQVMGKFLKLF
jgi:hypothetical protein